MTRHGVHRTGRTTASRGALVCALMGGLALASAPVAGWAQSTMTPAATMIENVASLTANSSVVSSNRVALQVQEIVDVRVDVLTPEVDVEANSHDQRVAFRITNIGNGPQAFDLTFTIVDGGFDPQACKMMIDWDGDGHYDPTRDRITNTTPVLQPGASVVAWVSCSVPADAEHGAWGRILVRAYAVLMRNGATQAQLSNAGAGGTYVVLGRYLRNGGGSGGGTSGGDGGGGTDGGTTGTTNTYVAATFRVGKIAAQLLKTQSVADPAGGARAVPGAVVTYSLEARFEAGPAVRDARITDAIPAGSTYVAGSLALDGASLSDATDADVGRVTDAGVEVGLGDITVPTRRVVTFKVRINALGSSK